LRVGDSMGVAGIRARQQNAAHRFFRDQNGRLAAPMARVKEPQLPPALSALRPDPGRTSKARRMGAIASRMEAASAKIGDLQ
jgi:hypothetical protein